jgi:hypothetical protein
MFGAHRSSIYGQTSATKTATLTYAAKDHTREALARELTTRTIRLMIIDEEFSEYHKLLDNTEAEDTPITLPSRPPYGAASSRLGQKRRGDDIARDNIVDTGASGNGTRPSLPHRYPNRSWHSLTTPGPLRHRLIAQGKLP